MPGVEVLHGRGVSPVRTSALGFDDVRAVGLTLPDVDEGTTYCSPALKVRGRMLACMAIHRSAEPNTLVVRLGFDCRDELIAIEPGIYYLTDHYVDYPSVLVRLGRLRKDAIRGLLLMGHRFVSARAKVKPRKRR